MMGIFSRKQRPNKAKSYYEPDTDTNGSHSGAGSFRSDHGKTANGYGYGSGYGSGPASVSTTPSAHCSFSGVNAAPRYVPRVDLPKPPDPHLDPAAYLRSLGAVRDRCNIVTERALKNRLNHFDVDITKFPDVVSFVCGIIKRDYDAPFTSIPSHGRYQHFCVGGRDRVIELLNTFDERVDTSERCRRLIDLFLISVLLDASAGISWSYKSNDNGRTYRRSEGLAVATFEMFKSGLFSSSPDNKFQVDRNALRELTVDQLASSLQSRPGNEVAGLEGRAQLLVRLGHALGEKMDFFGEEGRPGNMLDYLMSHPTTQASSMPIVVLPVLWNVLMTGLAPIWPTSRTAIDGVSLGDAWPCSSMPQSAPSADFSPFPNTSRVRTASWESILPFHKFTQWLTYSLMQPMQSLLKIHFAGTELLTGLPEYRNGGLFIDMGVLSLKRDDLDRGLENYSDYCRRNNTKGVEVAPMFEPGDDVIVEWRGVTVGFLDKLCVEVNRALARELDGGSLSLAQLLEAGSWKGGREIAEVSRPNTKEPPILIDSDGSIF